MAMKLHASFQVESAMRNLGTSKSGTDFVIQLTQPITFHNRSKRKQYFVRPQNIRLPIAFYNINSNYNTFTFNDDGTDYFVVLTPGNYTIDELIAELQTQMNATGSLTTYTITYDDITMKVNISSDGAGGITTITSDDGAGHTNTLYQLLGFEVGQTIPDGGNADGNGVAYTNTTKHIKLVIDNVGSSNTYSNTRDSSGNITSHLQKVSVDIPITEIRNEFQFFHNNDGPMDKLPNLSSIHELRVRLLDTYNGVVDMNLVPWGFRFCVYELNQ